MCEMSALLFFGTVGLHPHVCYVGDELLLIEIETQAAANKSVLSGLNRMVGTRSVDIKHVISNQP